MSYTSAYSESSLPRPINAPQRHKNSFSMEGHTLGRSFVYSSFRDTSYLAGSTPPVHSTTSVHEDTANLASIGLGEEEGGGENAVIDSSESLEGRSLEPSPPTYGATGTPIRYNITTGSPSNGSPSGSVPRLSGPFSVRPSSYSGNYPISPPEVPGGVQGTPAVSTSRPSLPDDLESLSPKNTLPTISLHNIGPLLDIDHITSVSKDAFHTALRSLPAVFLGTLLNILDALSYGMIMFPLSEASFSNMAPTGLSMFYVSTIVSQLVYSLGGSAFKAGIGSEMIEVTPFFHQMATSIMYSMGEDNQAGVLATTMVTFAFSSIITGICFGLLGKFRLGKLVGFFPRHILVGCVGGVGYFLVVTAVEVCSRIDGGIQYNWDTMKYLFQPLVLLQWVFPLSLTFLLVVAQHLIRSPLLVPGYIILVFVGFHLLIALVPQWNLQSAREYGWIFPLQQSQEPWWSFYKLYSFSKVDWWLVVSQIPTIFALTFFGVLHVPINVPALALSTGTDAVDVDRELLAHGVSNVLSGLAGSIQNYLVYTNSVLFIRAGADSRLSGVLLAMATVCVMCSGPAIIGYIPVCVVGVLVFLLGYELVKEALWDTWGRVRPFEYTTIAVIVATMGAVDFVVGILVGILLACVSFVVQASSEEVVTGIYSGEYARSIVVRHPKQLEFLERVGRQTCVFKLTGSLFFGSIGGLEEKVRSRFARQSWQREPVKFLILDANRVSGIDFSAAEGFRRIRNLVVEKGCYLLISSVDQGSAIVRALEDCGLWETEEHRERVQLFNNLNSALEWSENRFLADVAELAGSRSNSKRAISFSANVPTSAIPARSPSFSDKNPLLLPRDPSFPGQSNNRVPLLFGLSPSDHLSMLSGSPRHVQLLSAAQKSLTAERQDILLAKSTASAHSRPLPLLLKVMQGLSDTLNESLWAKLCPYLQQLEFQPGDTVYNRNVDPPAVFFVEQGLIDYEISFNNLQFSLKSSVLPLTMFGEIVKTRSDRKLVYTASTRSVLWKLDRDSIERLRIENTQVYEQLLAVCLRLASQRYDATTSNILVSL